MSNRRLHRWRPVLLAGLCGGLWLAYFGSIHLFDLGIVPQTLAGCFVLGLSLHFYPQSLEGLREARSLLPWWGRQTP
jgi:fructose-specific phosphotransferase system IIC component